MVVRDTSASTLAIQTLFNVVDGTPVLSVLGLHKPSALKECTAKYRTVSKLVHEEKGGRGLTTARKAL